MRKVIGAIILMLLCATAAKSKERERVKVEVTDSGEKSHVEHTLLHREKIRQRAVINVVISGQHVRLLCNGSCEDLAPGEYEGEIHGTSVKLFYTIPLTDKRKHDCYTISGGW